MTTVNATIRRFLDAETASARRPIRRRKFKGEPSPVRLCALCNHEALCRAQYGAFWADKSRGGLGCDHPVAPTEAERAREPRGEGLS